MEKTTLGQALIERRIELGIDKSTAATRIGVTRATYAAYESDSRRVSVESLPTLRAFLDVAVEDFLELYGATCVAQARVVILRDLFVSDASKIERPAPTSMMVKNVRDNEMSVVERVFFDVVTAKGHGVAPQYVTQPSAAPSALRASTSSVLGRFDGDVAFSSTGATIEKDTDEKKQRKKKTKKSKSKKQAKAKEINKLGKKRKKKKGPEGKLKKKHGGKQKKKQK
jgi:transcriptional regulator with XRE-family HTH domain